MTDKIIWIKNEIVIKAFGGQKAGKGHLINKVKEVLESKGFKTIWNPTTDEFALRVQYIYGVDERMQGVDYNGELIE